MTETAVDGLLTAIREAGRGPAPGDLESAPHLHFWRLVADGPILRADGMVIGHPVLDDGQVLTSPILGYDLSGGWLRTRSRWYGLGVPADPRHIEALDAAAQRLLAALRRKTLAAWEARPC